MAKPIKEGTIYSEDATSKHSPTILDYFAVLISALIIICLPVFVIKCIDKCIQPIAVYLLLAGISIAAGGFTYNLTGTFKFRGWFTAGGSLGFAATILVIATQTDAVSSALFKDCSKEIVQNKNYKDITDTQRP